MIHRFSNIGSKKGNKEVRFLVALLYGIETDYSDLFKLKRPQKDKRTDPPILVLVNKGSDENRDRGSASTIRLISLILSIFISSHKVYSNDLYSYVNNLFAYYQLLVRQLNRECYFLNEILAFCSKYLGNSNSLNSIWINYYRQQFHDFPRRGLQLARSTLHGTPRRAFPSQASVLLKNFSHHLRSASQGSGVSYPAPFLTISSTENTQPLNRQGGDNLWLFTNLLKTLLNLALCQVPGSSSNRQYCARLIKPGDMLPAFYYAKTANGDLSRGKGGDCFLLTINPIYNVLHTLNSLYPRSFRKCPGFLIGGERR